MFALTLEPTPRRYFKFRLVCSRSILPLLSLCALCLRSHLIVSAIAPSLSSFLPPLFFRTRPRSPLSSAPFLAFFVFLSLLFNSFAPLLLLLRVLYMSVLPLSLLPIPSASGDRQRWQRYVVLPSISFFSFLLLLLLLLFVSAPCVSWSVWTTLPLLFARVHVARSPSSPLLCSCSLAVRRFLAQPAQASKRGVPSLLF